MLLTFKTLQGQTFTLEVDSSVSVSFCDVKISSLFVLANSNDCVTFVPQVKELKDKVEAEKGSETYPADKQKLIYNGKVLENADPLSKYEINEKKFLVVMVPKPQAAPASKPAEAAPSGAAATASQPASQDQEMKEEKPKEEATTKKSDEAEKKTESNTTPAAPTNTSSSTAGTPTEPSSGSGPDSGDIVVGEEFNRMVQNIMDMGYGRDEV